MLNCTSGQRWSLPYSGQSGPQRASCHNFALWSLPGEVNVFPVLSWLLWLVCMFAAISVFASVSHACLFLDSWCACTRYLHGWVCVYVNGDVWSASLLQYESCGDVNRSSHSHAWPKHMALRHHTPCLHVLPFTLPLLLSHSFFHSLTKNPPFSSALPIDSQTMAATLIPCYKYLSIT